MARSPGPGGFAVAASRAAEGGTVEIGTGTSAGAAERRQLRINGAAAALTSLGEWLSVLWLTPAMDRLFTEGASARRRFLDRLTLARSEEHTSELQSLMRISYAVFCLKKNKRDTKTLKHHVPL